jgi:ketosteroid isomerase-like protein
LASAIAPRSEAIVVRWVEAFNARDLDGMLACLANDVEFRPLRLSGVSGCYRGHDGVREWFTRLRRWRQDHPIVIHGTRAVGEAYVLVTGAIRLDGESDIGSFCAVNWIDDGLILAAHHYLSDADMIERLGLIP